MISRLMVNSAEYSAGFQQHQSYSIIASPLPLWCFSKTFLFGISEHSVTSVLNFANRAGSTSSGRFSGFKIANKRRSCLFTSTLRRLIRSQSVLGGNAGYLRIRRRFVTELHLSSSHLYFFPSSLACTVLLYSGCCFFFGCFCLCFFLSSNFTLWAEKGKTKTTRERADYFPSLRSSFKRSQKEQSGLHLLRVPNALTFL